MKILTKNGKTLHISEGNKKLGNIPNFNLPPVKACAPQACASCGRDCYAMKAYRLYPNVRSGYNENLDIIKNNIDDFKESMNTFLNQPNAPRFFRIHTAGDFVTKEYAQSWYELIQSHPQTKFLIFTKYWDNIRGIKFYELPNCKLYLSDWPGMIIPEDLKEIYPVAYMDDGTRDPDTFANANGCPGDCSNCFGCCVATGSVVFKKH